MPSTAARSESERAGSFLFLGGHPALDLLNTVTGVGVQAHELLADGAALRGWCAAAAQRWPDSPLGALEHIARPGAAPEPAWQRAVPQVRAVRELGRALLAAWHSGRPQRARLEELRGRLQQVTFRAVLDTAGDGFTLAWKAEAASPREVPGLLAVALADLLAEAERTAVKCCAGPGCSLTFLDRTKARRRVFCSAALCGNRAKVAAWRARQHGG